MVYYNDNSQLPGSSHGDFSTFALLPICCAQNNAVSLQPYGGGFAGHDGTGHDGRHIPLSGCPGGSDRTVQHFCSQTLPWAMLLWVCFCQHGYRADEVSRLVGDEVVATKAGQHPHGLERFFSRR